MPGSTPCSMSSRPAAPAAATAAVPRPVASSRRRVSPVTAVSPNAGRSMRCRPAHRLPAHGQRERHHGQLGHVDRAGPEQGPGAVLPGQYPAGRARPGRRPSRPRPAGPAGPDSAAAAAAVEPAHQPGQPGGQPGQCGRADHHPGELRRREGQQRGRMRPVGRDRQGDRPAERGHAARHQAALRPRMTAGARPAVSHVPAPDDQHQQADRDQQQRRARCAAPDPTPGQPPARRHGRQHRQDQEEQQRPGHHHGAHRGGPGAGRAPTASRPAAATTPRCRR